MKLFSNLSSSNFSNSVQQFPNFLFFIHLKAGTNSQPLFGFPIFQVVLTNVPIFQVGVHRFPIFQAEYIICSSLKKGTSSQPLFGFPIFQVVLTNVPIFQVGVH